VEVQSGSHSDKLSDKDRICELVTHNVKPDCLDKYLKATENLIGKDAQNYRLCSVKRMYCVLQMAFLCRFNYTKKLRRSYI